MNEAAPFSEEQKEYLQGFLSGASIARQALGMPPLQQTSPLENVVPAQSRTALPAGPDKVHIDAQNRFLAAGKELTTEEKAKREGHPFDMWDTIVENAKADVFPSGTDVFKYKFYGLFFTGPNQNAFMSRLRLPNGILNAWQFAGLADLAERFGEGYAHITTRANLQIREIAARDAVAYLEGLFELGITSKGAGADNIRNITGSPIAGIDPQELIDTRPLAREIQHYVLNCRAFFGLPRKFNIAFDGGGRIGVLQESNDLGFSAVQIRDGESVPPGVYFRLALGGITGHGDLAKDAGVILRPEECTPVAAAMIRVFIDHGDRSDRRRARLKYVLDRLGHEGFLTEAETVLGYKLPRLAPDQCDRRSPIDRMGHIGVHPEREDDRFYIGIALPAGKLTSDQMRGLADLAKRFGDGDLRLTVWQNLLLSGIRGADVEAVKKAVDEMDLRWSVSHLRAGMVACTGAFGCRFALAHTKEAMADLLDDLDDRVHMDQPINVHMTGCPNSCAQHYIGDIGLLATRVDPGDEADDDVEGFHIIVGGGWGDQARIGRELYRDITRDRLPVVLERMLRSYLERRRPDESFSDFTNRHEVEALRQEFGIEA